MNPNISVMCGKDGKTIDYLKATEEMKDKWIRDKREEEKSLIKGETSEGL